MRTTSPSRGVTRPSAVLVLVAVVVLAASCGSAGTESVRAEPEELAPIDAGSIVSVTTDAEVVELGPDGATRTTLTQLEEVAGVNGLSLAPDRRRMYVGIRRPEDGVSTGCVSAIVEVDSAGATTEVGSGSSPVVSPDGSQLAFATIARRDDICYVVGIAVIDLDTGSVRPFEFATPVPDSGPPDWNLSWAPSGDRVAYRDQAGVRVLEVSGGDTDAALVIDPSLLLPAFVDDTHIAGLRGCCTGPQEVVIVDLATGTTDSWFMLNTPPVVLNPNDLHNAVIVTALDQLFRLTSEGLRKLRTGVVAADA
jgi:hypothetical protein